MSYYNTGDILVAEATIQGLVKGERYHVLFAESQLTPFGEFVTYTVRAAGPGKVAEVLHITNGHLLLRRPLS